MLRVTQRCASLAAWRNQRCAVMPQNVLPTTALQVEVEVPKSVLKQGAVQHLYGKVCGTLRPGEISAVGCQRAHWHAAHVNRCSHSLLAVCCC